MDRSKISLKLFFPIIALWILQTKAFATPVPFKFHLKENPTLDVTKASPGESTYLFSQLLRGLTRFDGSGQLIFDQAKKCRFKIDTELICELRKEALWNDGSPVRASDFVRAFRRIVAPESKCPAVGLLLGLKNAKMIYSGRGALETLGVRALDESHVQFSLEERDTEFLEKLSNPMLVPYREPKNVSDPLTLPTNGPYKIKSWVKFKKIELEPFDSYFGARAQRPNVEIYFAAEDSAGLTLYEKGITNFLWRLTTINIPKYKDRPDFVQIPLSRFDYVGFNLRPGSPFEKKEVRKAFAQSLNFEDFKKAFFALGAPGCPGLGEPFLFSENHCVEFQASQTKLQMKPIRFMYSELGGDDIKRAAEWFQAQWHQNLGVDVKLQGMDQKQYVALLRKNPPDAFRTGVPLNRPTCLAALERFQKDNPDNFTGFFNQRFETLAVSLSKQKLSLSEKESVCGVATDILFKEEFVGIPLGRIHFSMLVNPHFKGWTVNSLNQLDLSQLQYTP